MTENLCIPSCPICGGAGWVRLDVPSTDKRFGRLFPCPSLPSGSKQFNNHGLTEHERKTLTWRTIKNRENVGQALKAVKETLQRGKGQGYLYGGAGLAKTLILKTACAEWARAGRGIFHYTNLADILDDLRSAYDDDQPSRALRMKEEKYSGFSLLCIDEIGAQRLTEFGAEKFFSLINRRHEAGTERGENLITLLAGNASPKEIDFRITDRLTDGRNFIVQLTGLSYRPAATWENQNG